MATKVVTVNPLPTVNAVSNASIICVGQSATVTASGASTYSYSPSIPLSGVISPSTTTTYTVIGTSSVGCSGMTTLTQSVSLCTGLNGQSYNSNLILLYPNPSAGIVNIEFINGLTKTIQIADVTGRIVREAVTSDDNIKIDISTLANGIYYFKIQSNKTSDCLKVVKY
jgi:hypothetical protein